MTTTTVFVIGDKQRYISDQYDGEQRYV